MYIVWCVTPLRHKQILIRKKTHLYLKVWIQQCSIMHDTFFFLMHQLLTAFWLWILPLRRDASIWLQSAAHWGRPPRFTSADKKLSAPTCCRPAKDFRMKLDKDAHTLWSHWGKRLRVVQFCDSWRLVCVFIDDFHKTPQNTAYSTVYKVLLCLGSKAVTAQLSLSLIKYWTRGIREKLRAEKKKKPTSDLISCVFLHL